MTYVHDLRMRVLDTDKDEGWQREQVDHVDRVIPPHATGWILGANRATDVDGRVKYLERPVWPVTGSEMGRRWLDDCLASAGRKRTFWHGEDLALLDQKPPLFYDPDRSLGPWAMLDLTAAFFSAYSPAALDLKYLPGRAIGRGSVRFLARGEVGGHKPLRNSVYGLVRSQTMIVLDNGHATVRSLRSRHLAPMLARWTIDLIHAIALDTIATWGSPWWYVDSCVVRPDDVANVMTWMRETWGMDLHLLGQGAGRLWSISDYQIGRRMTKRVKELRPIVGGPVDTLDHTIDIKQMRKWRSWML